MDPNAYGRTSDARDLHGTAAGTAPNDQEQQPSKMGAAVNQVKGNVEKAWGTMTGSEVKKAQGDRHLVEAKAEKHMARAAQAAEQAARSGADAAWEEGKAEKKIGKVLGDPDIEGEGQFKKDIGREMRDALESQDANRGG